MSDHFHACHELRTSHDGPLQQRGAEMAHARRRQKIENSSTTASVAFYLKCARRLHRDGTGVGPLKVKGAAKGMYWPRARCRPSGNPENTPAVARNLPAIYWQRETPCTTATFYYRCGTKRRTRGLNVASMPKY